MTRTPIDIAFNPDNMTVMDLKCCASALASIFDSFDQMDQTEDSFYHEDMANFTARVLQMRNRYRTPREQT